MDNAGEAGFQKLIGRAKILTILLVIGLALTVAFFLFEVAEILGIWSIDNVVDIEAPMALLYSAIALGHSAVFFITVIFFSIWIYQAAANVIASDVDGFEYTPGWSVGWYFVPFANLVKPFQVMRQIRNASYGANVHLDDGNSQLTMWWTAWLVTSIAGNISTRLTLRAETLETLLMATQVGAVSSIASFVLYPVVIKLVKDITGAQQEHLKARFWEEQFA
ncbi:DUF4328 domain-containing protein [Sphingorhabdus sp. Alg231-15]|uniref:DUF4328 domain-containing protein n=1 Tax=Sphingorhabdus sp. Alg231-15 TaxID=1922222 RepID=UPI000D54B1C2